LAPEIKESQKTAERFHHSFGRARAVIMGMAKDILGHVLGPQATTATSGSVTAFRKEPAHVVKIVLPRREGDAALLSQVLLEVAFDGIPWGNPPAWTLLGIRL
jgi:hypothetical protein